MRSGLIWSLVGLVGILALAKIGAMHRRNLGYFWVFLTIFYASMVIWRTKAATEPREMSTWTMWNN